MAMQVIDDPYRYGGAHGVGRSVDRGLSGLLNMMTQQKMKKFQQQERGRGISDLYKLLGAPEQFSAATQGLPEGLQDLMFKQFAGSEAFPAGLAALGQQPVAGQQQEQSMDGLGAMLQQGTEPEGQQPQPVEQGIEDMEIDPQLQARLGEKMQAGDFDKLEGKLSPDTLKDLENFNPAQKKAMTDALSDAPADVKRRVKRAFIPSTENKAIQNASLQRKPTAKKSFAELLATPRPTKADRARAEGVVIKEALEAKKMDLAERKFQFKKQSSIDASTKEDYNKIKDNYKGAVENDWRLNKLDELAKKGNLADPKTAALIKAAGVKGYGIDLSSLMTADSQEFQKISNDFIKNAKAIFGARVTEGEIRLFLQTVPNLMQTAEGKRRIIRNMKMFNEAHKLRFNAMNEVITMNDDERPKNLGKIVEKKIKPQMDVLGKEFAKIKDFGMDQQAKASKPGVMGKLGFESPGEVAAGIPRAAGKAIRTAASAPVWLIKEMIKGMFS